MPKSRLPASEYTSEPKHRPEMQERETGWDLSPPIRSLNAPQPEPSASLS
jgi:hypothetical protein